MICYVKVLKTATFLNAVLESQCSIKINFPSRWGQIIISRLSQARRIFGGSHGFQGKRRGGGFIRRQIVQGDYGKSPKSFFA